MKECEKIFVGKWSIENTKDGMKVMQEGQTKRKIK